MGTRTTPRSKAKAKREARYQRAMRKRAAGDSSPIELAVEICQAPGVSGPLNAADCTLPAAGFSGQDTVAFRVNNGVADSETFRVNVFVVPRPPAVVGVPTTHPPVLVQAAPFLSASATPRLDRKRTTLVKISCDQDCSLAVRLTATLRTRKSLTGPQVKRSILAKQVVRVRLRLPTKPRGKLKTVWITGSVRNVAGAVRTVKLPVRLPR